MPDKGFGVQVPVRTRKRRESSVGSLSNDVYLPDFIYPVADYPKPGILFKDITPLLADGRALSKSIDLLGENFSGLKSDAIAGIEARGFILGAAVAHSLGIGFIPLRKPGKSPRPVHSIRYALEYGEDELQVHKDLISQGMRIGIIDDVLATGGTAAASIDLVRSAEATVVGFACLLELIGLGGREKIYAKDEKIPVSSLIAQ